MENQSLQGSMTAKYLHALVCKAALHPIAAENETRMEALPAPGSKITCEAGDFEATLRLVQHEAITAEIIELGTGAASSRDVS